jgi:hypothetical protein
MYPWSPGAVEQVLDRGSAPPAAAACHALVHVLQGLADGGKRRLLVAPPHAFDNAGDDGEQIVVVPLLRRRLRQVSVDEAIAPAGGRPG